MSTVGERVRAVRNDQKMTMKQFGSRIGISDAAVSQIENGKTGISDRTIKAICREFKVSEIYLRTGAEEMYTSTVRERELKEFVNSSFDGKSEAFRLALVKALLRFDPESREWQVIEEIYNSILDEAKKSGFQIEAADEKKEGGD